MQVIKSNGQPQDFDVTKIQGHAEWACKDLDVSQSEFESSLSLQFYDGMPTSEIAKAMKMTATSMISLKQPDYDWVASRLTIQSIYKAVTGGDIKYPALNTYLSKGVFFQQLDKRLVDGRFDVATLEAAIVPDRDFKFAYLGIQTLADRYLLCEPMTAGKEKKVYELPQHFLMRVAMGLAILEDKPTERAIEFYNVMSQHEYFPSTPTLFNAGTNHPQMSSCYVGYVPDDLKGIFDYGITQNALLSKFAGGIGSDWTPVRSNGSIIKSTNGVSNGVVPFLKIYNQTAVAVNQGGKRKGSFAPYLEVWHGDIFDFADLRLQTGEDNLRTHDIHPAAWIPDLFMERKEAGLDWSLFSPSDVPHLHDLYGAEFKVAYEKAEADGLACRVVPAMELWKYLLDKLVRTGNPWLTFKDRCNERNPQAHCGVIHNSNLCTEITLNNSVDEVAVCNLGSIVLNNHIRNGRIDSDKLQRTVKTAVRMLDNVIDINYYPVPEARNSNLKHRPVGLGVMGYAEALVMSGIDWESQDHLQWADELFEEISYYSIGASADLAIERGAYESFKGSTWSKGQLTIDTFKGDKKMNVFSPMEWQLLREKVVATGIRNSNITAIAPTATIANIIGTTECIQLPNERISTKENLSGNFELVNPVMKHGHPELVKTVWEVDQMWTIKANCVRQKWVDQSQSLNLYRRAEHTGRVLDMWYTELWRRGGKTSYYLRNHKADKTAAAPVPEQKASAPIELPVHTAGYVEHGQNTGPSSFDQAVVGNTDAPFECEACQ